MVRHSRNRGEFVTSRMRLRDYDYSTLGYYFVTVCCQNRSHMFGKISNNQMFINPAGMMVNGIWDELPIAFVGVSIDSVVTMPNHIHVLVGIGVRTEDQEPLASLIEVLQWFKSMTTTRYIDGIREHGWPRYEGRLWQQGFHDHIVRSERELDVLRKYMVENPERWEDDVFREG